MKFYIDGNLVRTSKTHDYTHALMFGNSVLSCHGSYEAAVKAMNRDIAQTNQRIANTAAAIKAIDEGRDTYRYRYGRETWWAKVTETREEYETYIAGQKESITRLKIRELEAR